MKISRKARRTISIFLLLNVFVQTMAPTVSYALTAGPTSPEFSSFEPVDTTDLVNLATGDFVYNLPLLEIPGPEGGYPLSLSYHGGIKLDQESSWVGLGFTLNPGAINRTVQGYPDDNLFTNNTVRDYWGGGTQVTKDYYSTITGYGFGVSNSFAITQDTYKGISNSHSVAPFIDPVGLAFSLFGEGDDDENSSSSGGNSVPKKFQHDSGPNLASTAYGMGALGNSVLGISIGSNGLNTFSSLGGGNAEVNAVNNSSGIISSFTTTKNGSGGGTLPIYGVSLFWGLKEYYTKYWSDESQGLLTYGALYPGIANTEIGKDFYGDGTQSLFNSFAMDIYENYDNSPISPISGSVTTSKELIATADDPTDSKKQLGGALPAYDRYEVLGQGIGGDIKPYIFENGDLNGQNIYARDPNSGYPELTSPEVSYKSLRNFSSKKVDFRFVNDFSNSLTIDPAQIKDSNGNYSVNLQQTHADQQGFNNTDLNQKLAGSRNIEWFTNDEISSGYATEHGLVDFYQNRGDRKLDFDVYANYLQPESCLPYSGGVTYGKGEGSFIDDTYTPLVDIYGNLSYPGPQFRSLKPRQVDLRKKIGGYKITNETGVVYHYALPVYSYSEYSRTKRNDATTPEGGIVPTFREYYNDDPYAYTWLLTAITGPDYVDVNNNGTLDDQDLGYWVKFDYGRWADAYQWRTPHSGYADEINGKYSTFSYGIKELYYLDAIETRSHKAIFIKSKRKDGRGVTSRLEGGSNPRQYSMTLYQQASTQSDAYGEMDFYVAPVSTMKLDAIYLFDKKDLSGIPVDKTRGEMYNEATSASPINYPYQATAPYSSVIPHSQTNEVITIDGSDFIPVKYHNGDLVYDNDDIQDIPEFTQQALRVINFNTDYSLASGVPNSFGYFGDTPSNTETCYDDYTNTCSGLDNRIGNNFEWPNINSDDHCLGTDAVFGRLPFCCQSGLRDNLLFYSQSGVINRFYNNSQCKDEYRGDRMVYNRTGKLTLLSVEFLGKGGVGLIPPITFAYGKNIPYQSNYYDEWGYYKNDYNNSLGATRRITPKSSTSVDAWSLTSITTSLGSEINVSYEPNQYQTSVYNDFSVFGIDKMEATTVIPLGNTVDIYFSEKNLDLNSWFKVGGTVDLNAFFVSGASTPEYELFFQNFAGNYNITTVTAIGQDMITVSNQTLYDMVTRTSFVLDKNSRGGRPQTNSYSCTTWFFSGFIKTNDPTVKYAGGIRVKSLGVTDNNLGTNSINYTYLDPSTGLSSGVTSFKPYNLPSMNTQDDLGFFQNINSEKNNNYSTLREELLMNEESWQKQVNLVFNDVLTYINETIPPGVVYGNVTTQSTFNSQPADSYSTYQFRTYDAGMVQKNIKNYSTGNFENRLVSINSKISSVGSIMSAKTFDNTGTMIKAVNYGYLLDNAVQPFEQAILNSKQGIVEQAFNKHVVVASYDMQPVHNRHNFTTYKPVLAYSKEKVLTTLKQEQVDVATSIEQIDYKKGITTVSNKLAFDFYSGQAAKVLTTDSYGNNYLTTTTPAYQVYASMGLPIYNWQNKNMLAQEMESDTYIVDAANTPSGLLSATVQTWSDQVPVLGMAQPQTNVWRKQSSYVWNGQQAVTNGVYPINDFNANRFNTADLSTNTNWLKTGEMTLYDPYSHSLEASDINGNHASTRMDPAQMKVTASTANAAYYETAYSGVEFSSGNSLDEGDVDRGGGSVTNLQFHTGNNSLLVGSGSTGFNYTLSSGKADLTRNYRASVWVYIPGAGEVQSEMNNVQLYYSINGNETAVYPTLQKSKSKSWYLMNLDVIPDGTNNVFIGVRNNSSRGVYFDDFRVHPLDASMSAYVYDPHTSELIYVLDADNIYTHYEYDAMGRLIRKSREQLNYDFGNGKESYKPDHIIGDVLYNYGKKN